MKSRTYVAGVIENCTVSCDVTGTGKSAREGVYGVGGIVGCNYRYDNKPTPIIMNCTILGSVAGAERYVGGIIGYNCKDGNVLNCTVNASVTGAKGNVGEIAGFNDGVIVNSKTLSKSDVKK